MAPARRRRPLLVAWLLVSGVLLIAASRGQAPAAHAQELTSGTDFGISGSVTNLVPGVATPLTVTVTNPTDFDIALTSVTVSASPNPSVPVLPATCPATDLNLVSGSSSYGFQGGVPQVTVTFPPPQPAVPAHATAAFQSLSLLLARGAGNNCQDVVFPLVYSATASVAAPAGHGAVLAATGAFDLGLVAGAVLLLAGLILVIASLRRREANR